MSSLLEEYKAYYMTRAKRYEGNAKYVNSYHAEMNMSHAMNACAVLEEFKDKLGNLNDLAGVALIIDEHLIEQKHYENHEEWVRKKAADTILDKAESWTDIGTAITQVQEISQDVSLQIIGDETQRELMHKWQQLDSIKIYEAAEVPDEYKQYMTDVVKDTKQDLVESTLDLETNTRQFIPDFVLKPEMINEPRHRRFIVYKDEDLNGQLEEYKNIINR